MNKNLLISSLLLLALCIPGIVAQTMLIDNDAEVTLERVEPDPAKPDNYVDVFLRFTVPNSNTRDPKLNNIEVEIIPEFPLLLNPGETGKENIGSLVEGGFSTFKHRLLVDSSITGETARFQVRYKSDKGTSLLSDYFEIDVRHIDPGLSIDQVTLNPERIRPGSVAEMTLSINNPTNNLMSDVSIDLTLPDIFTPSGETATKRIKQIAPGSAHSVSFKLIADPAAKANAYKIPLQIEFTDPQGTTFSRNETLGILVDAKPEIFVTIEESEVFMVDQSGNVVVSIANTGPSEIKFLTLELVPDSSYEILSASKVYVGDLSPDDFETIQFELFLNDASLSQLKLYVTYKDSFNQPQEAGFAPSLTVYSKEEAARLGLTNQPNSPKTYIIYAIAILFLLQVIRNWRREHDLWKGFKVSLKNDFKGVGRFIIRLLRGFKRPKQ